MGVSRMVRRMKKVALLKQLDSTEGGIAKRQATQAGLTRAVRRSMLFEAVKKELKGGK